MEDADFKKKLTREQYKVMREKDTQPPFTGNYLHNKKNGMYECAACGNKLFSSKDKFDSGTGWPSFAKASGVKLRKDYSHFMIRDEVICAKCESHLGHVFDDGPGPEGKRFCINDCALDFKEARKT